ncbi:ribonuclease H-like domain-containing protein [Tanacetum coccineum]
MYCLSSSLSFSPATSKTGKTISSIRPPLIEDQRGSSVTSLSATLAILRINQCYQSLCFETLDPIKKTNKKTLYLQGRDDLEDYTNYTTDFKFPVSNTENGNSFKLEAQTTTNADGTSTTLIPGPVTTEEKAQKKNDVKDRSMLLMALPNEHQKDFLIQYTRMLRLCLLLYKQDLMNKPDLDTMSFDDLYNNFKIVEQEVKGTYKGQVFEYGFCASLAVLMILIQLRISTAKTQVSHASTDVSTTSTQEGPLVWGEADMRTRRFFQKIGRKITINGSDTSGYNKFKVKCFNCHKMGHFARECKGHRNQDSRNRNQENSIRTINVEEISSKAMVAIDGAIFDWSYMADDELRHSKYHHKDIAMFGIE